MKDIHMLRLFEFAKHLNRKEFLNPSCFGQHIYLQSTEIRNGRKQYYRIKTQKFVLDALVIFYEWNFNENSQLVYKAKTGITDNVIEGMLNFFGLTVQQLAHVLDIQNRKYYRPRLFGGKKLHPRSKAKDFCLNMKNLLEKEQIRV